jgi:tetratricopeptide (TPR) repeat protein/serine phosphatase RsbU (regulator of sigma subunit)
VENKPSYIVIKNVIIKSITCLLLFSFYYSPIFAQGRAIDSLRHVLKAEQEDTNKVNTLNILSDKLRKRGQYDTSIICAASAQTLALKLDFKRGIMGSYRNIGLNYREQGNYAQALEQLNRALALAVEIGDKGGMTASLGNIGIIYINQGNYSKALEYMLKVLSLYSETGNKDGINTALSNIGTIYYSQGNYPQALDYTFKALAIANERGDKSSITTNLGNIGLIYSVQGNYSEALDYDFKTLAIYQEMGSKDGIANTLGNIGLVYFRQRNNSKALEYYEKALSMDKELGDKEGIAVNLGNMSSIYQIQRNYSKVVECSSMALKIDEEIGNKSGIAINLCNMGNINIKQKNYKQARIYLDSSLSLSKNIGSKENIKESYDKLSDLDSTTGDYKSAIEDVKMYIIYRDSLVNEANTKKSVQAEMNFEFEQKQAIEKAGQDKKDAIAEQESKKQMIIRNAFIGGFMLMLTLAFFIFRSYRQKQKANEIISEQKAVVEEKQKEILDSIHYAQRIQKALLASDSLLSKHLPDYFVLYKPKDIVSGDFYWATEKNDSFYLAVCDSTGHGVPGAFMSLLNISFLNEAITEKNILQPNDIFNHTRKRLIENISQDGQQDGMDGVLIKITAPPPPKGGSNEGSNLLNIPPLEGGEAVLSYSGAYNAPIVVRNGQAIELEADKIPVGTSPKDNISFTNHSFDLQKGDIIYIFTDGFADQFGGVKGKKFKHQQLKEMLAPLANLSMQNQKQKLESAFNEWKGKLEQVDDVLIIGIRV